MTRRRLAILLFVVLAAGLLVVLFPPGASTKDQAAGGQDVFAQVMIERLRPERVVLKAELSGRIAAWRRVEIRPQIGGVILDRLVDEGARVAAGDVLFHIDPAPLKADLAMAEAALARAETGAAHARRTVERSDALLARSAVSTEKNDTARNDLALAEAGLAEARAQVERKRLDLEFATLQSPIDGYVAAGLADPGGLASPGGGTALAVIQDLDKVYVDLRLPVAQLDAVRSAAESGLGPVEIATDHDQGPVLQGQLKFSDVIVDPGTGNVSVRIEVANPDLALLPGMFVRAVVPAGMVPDALLVPEDAVLRKGDGKAQLVVVSETGEATHRAVTLGARIGNRVVITSGVSPGEAVAIAGQDRVPEGIPTAVTILADAAPAQAQQK